MTCPNCGNFNDDGFKLCIKCGSSLETSTTNISNLLLIEL